MSRMLPLLVLFAACSGDEAKPPPEVPTTPPVGAVVAPVPEADPAGPRVPATTTSRMAASHVLVSYAGAVNALPSVSRTKEEARARAEDVRSRLLAGEDFVSVAKTYSDDSTGPRGGSLGGFMEGTMVPPFEAAVKALKVGELSEIVETPFGFHVIRRDALVEVHAQHILVSWKGAESAPAGVVRTKEEAKARIDELVTKLGAGEAWDEVARQSDGPLKEDGGDLGWFGRGQLAPQLDSVAFDLDIGATSAVIESPRGYHLLRRVE